MTFAADYRDTAIPRLRAEIRAQGFLVALDLAEFDDAHDAITALADRLGGWHLPTANFNDLREQCLSQLSAAVLAADALIQTARAEIAAEQQADLASHYERLALGCRQPERMRWAFAAWEQDYRRYLVAERADAR